MFKQPLTRCPSCKLNAVVPIMDECQERKGHWLLSLRCSACYACREILVTQEQAEVFDRALDDEERKLRAALRRMERASMADDVARFAAALEADAILPEDFVR